MPFVIGMLVGRAFAQATFSRAVGLLLLWFCPPYFAGVLITRVWPSEAVGANTAFATAVAMLLFALRRPASSRLKLTLLEGVAIWARLFAIAVAVYLFCCLAFGRPTGGFLAAHGRAVVAFACFALAQHATIAWVARDHAALERAGRVG